MEGGPPCFPPGFSCPAVLWLAALPQTLRIRDFYPLWTELSISSFCSRSRLFAAAATPLRIAAHRFGHLPLSLATTCGITFVFFSCGYLDVSVPRVCLPHTMDSCADARVFGPGGFPHSDTCGSQTICVSPQLFAACRVLHRLLVPGHSPCALNSLTCAGRHRPAEEPDGSSTFAFRSF